MFRNIISANFQICRNTIAISCGDCQEEPKKEDDVKDVKDVDDVNPQDNEIITIMRPSEMPIYCETCQIRYVTEPPVWTLLKIHTPPCVRFVIRTLWRYTGTFMV